MSEHRGDFGQVAAPGKIIIGNCKILHVSQGQSHMEANDLLNAILSEVKSIQKSSCRWMDIEDLSDYLGLKVNTIYQYVSQKKIPCKKIPGSSKLIFSRKEIDRWIENGKASDQNSGNAKTESTRIMKDIENKHS